MGKVGTGWIQDWTGWGKVRAEMGEGLEWEKLGQVGSRFRVEKS